MSTLSTVEQVMRETKTPMSVRDIVEAAGDALPTRSKTPDTVVARDLSMDIKRLGADSKFIRTAPGRYTMREYVVSGLVKMGDSGTRPLAVRHQSPLPAKANGGNGTTSVLASALRDGRQGMLPAQGASADDGERRRESVDSGAAQR